MQLLSGADGGRAGGAVRSSHFFPEGCEPVVAFRGTDDSVVGWKEDFRLAFRKPLASQEMSSVYLNQVGCKLPGAFMVCGHSKGGNLAAYAATWAETGVQRRITDIYSLDGPGFLPEVFEGDSYEQIRSVCTGFAVFLFGRMLYKL